jgi:hypothetical protein
MHEPGSQFERTMQLRIPSMGLAGIDQSKTLPAGQPIGLDVEMAPASAAVADKQRPIPVVGGWYSHDWDSDLWPVIDGADDLARLGANPDSD